MWAWIRIWFALNLWLAPLAGKGGAEEGYIVRYHPAGKLHAGDLISIEVISPPGAELERQEIGIRLANGPGGTIGRAQFAGFSEGRYRAILQWGWDTGDLKAGAYELHFAIPACGVEWSETVWLAEKVEDGARWEQRETQCCRVHTITGTAAARDIDRLAGLIEAQANSAAAKFGVRLNEKIEINLVPRVLGQGGFASEQIYISYSDQNYAHGSPMMLIEHELIHQVDRLAAGQTRPDLLIEGVAVYLAGGHYKREPVMLRAAALVHLKRYLRLAYLADHFYPAQHETGYIEGGALVEFMVQQWGWSRFLQFYRDIPSNPNGSQAAAIDAASRRYFGLGLADLEERLLEQIERLPALDDVQREVDLTIRLYDQMRAYQKKLDPSAYFEQVWLPDARQMRERGIVADYLRSPDGAKNRTVEALLKRAGERLRAGDYAGAEADMGKVAKALAQEEGNRLIVGINSGAVRLVTPAPPD